VLTEVQELITLYTDSVLSPLHRADVHKLSPTFQRNIVPQSSRLK
jgi:hypothetical protein